MPNTIEQIRDSRVWDLRDMGYDVSKVEMRPVGDKWILSVQMERPITIEEELHPKIAELAPSETTETTEEKTGDEAGDPPAGGSGESGTTDMDEAKTEDEDKE